jgi:hypothetical protein
VAAPDLAPPVAVRAEGDPPVFERVGPPNPTGPGAGAEADAFVGRLVDVVGREASDPAVGNVAVVCPRSWYEPVVDGLRAAGVEVGAAPRDGLDHQVTVVPVNLVKGLEVDVAVVVEPAAMVREEPQGHRSLYVAMTRATKRLVVVHAEDLPEVLDTGTDTGTGSEPAGA